MEITIESLVLGAALGKNEGVLRLLFERNADAISILDGKRFVFADCNEAVVRMLRANSKNQICNKHPAALSPEIQPDGRNSFEKADEILKCIKQGSQRFEWMHRRFDGEDFLVEVSLNIVQLADSPLVVAVWREIGEHKRLEVALKASEEKFRLMFERSADSMMLLDGKTSCFIDCNAATLASLRLDNKDRLIGRRPWEISPEHQPDGRLSTEKAKGILKRVEAMGSERFEWVHVRGDGTPLPVEIVLTSIELGTQPQVLAVWRDITKRQEALAQIERTLSLQSATIESTADGILVVDHNGNISSYNQRFVEMWRLSQEALDAKDDQKALMWVLDQLSDPDTFLYRVKEVYSCPESESFDLLSFKDGRTFERHSRPQRLGSSIVGRVWCFRDVTERRQAEQEILELNATLERRVEERTAALRQAQIDLEKALVQEKELAVLKTNFVSIVSHEFRTPLGVISVSSEVLQRYFERLTHEQRTEHLDAIVQNVRRMAHMMEDVLLLSRVDSERMEFKPISLNIIDFIDKLAEDVCSAMNQVCSIEIDCDSAINSIPAYADKFLLHHIFTNLLSNAIKYSPAGSPIIFRIRRDHDIALFEISDRGLGIPQRDQERIFTAFHRAKNAEHIYGTGLGLVIVKRCCDLHNGEISVHSVVGSGTSFIVRLPLFEPSQQLVAFTE